MAIYSATAPSVLDVSHPAHHWMVEHLVRAITRFAEAFERGKEAGTVRPEMPSVAVARSLTALSDGLRLQWLCATTPDNGAKAVLDTDMVGEMRRPLALKYCFVPSNLLISSLLIFGKKVCRSSSMVAMILAVADRKSVV